MRRRVVGRARAQTPPSTAASALRRIGRCGRREWVGSSELVGTVVVSSWLGGVVMGEPMALHITH